MVRLIILSLCAIVAMLNFCTCNQPDQDVKKPFKIKDGKWVYEFDVPYSAEPDNNDKIIPQAMSYTKFKHWDEIGSCPVKQYRRGAKTELAFVKRIEPRLLEGELSLSTDDLWSMVKYVPGARRSICCAAKCKGIDGYYLSMDGSPTFKRVRVSRMDGETGQRQHALIEYAADLFGCMCWYRRQEFHERTSSCPIPEEDDERFCCEQHERNLYICEETPKWAKYALKG